jgi:hypothetical protein
VCICYIQQMLARICWVNFPWCCWQLFSLTRPTSVGLLSAAAAAYGQEAAAVSFRFQSA